jgi:signal transduction histidine kinase
MSFRSKLWITVATGLVATQTAASLVLPAGFARFAVSDIVQCALLLSGTLALLLNALKSRHRSRVFWSFMTVGVGLWFVYQLLWTYFEVVLRQDVPNPFSGDVVLFLHIVPMMAALVLQPDLQQDERKTRLGSLDFALLFMWWLYLYLFAVIPWQYALTNQTTYEHNLNVLYLTEKTVFLVGLLFVWTRSRTGWRSVYAQWFGASLTYAFSSYLANWAIERNVYTSGSLYDVPLAISMAWVTVLAVRSLGLQFNQQETSPSTGYGVWVARSGMIAILSLPLFAAWSIFDISTPAAVRTFRLVTTLFCMMVMGAMVFAKQQLLDRELLRLLGLSRRSYEDLKQLQAQLVQSEKLASLGQLAGGAAHELNNPLTAMLGYSDLLIATPLDDPQRALAEKIGGQVRRTKSLVASLLTFAKQNPSNKTSVDLNSVAQTAIKLCHSQLSTHRIQVQVALTPELPPVLGDSNQLLQLFVHIINNSIHSLNEHGGSIRIATQNVGNQIVLEFSDEASRPEAVAGALVTSSAGTGSAVGLSACYSIVQEHGGKIYHQNRSDGAATFRIEIPRANVKTATPSRSAEPEFVPLPPSP